MEYEFNHLSHLLLMTAHTLANEMYGCDLELLDPEIIEFFTSRVTEDNLENLALALANVAWFEN